MLLPETKEREAQFKLAIRMGFPIFLLLAILLFSLLSRYLDTIPYSFAIIGIGTFAVAVYFLFYLIYKGHDERITDPITRMFTREYGINLFKKEIEKEGVYTFVLISINNLSDINERYGIKNGDIVLYETAQWIGNFFQEKGVKNFPISVLKGGDYLIGLRGNKSQYKTMMDILCMKVEDYIIKDIEVHITGAIVDTSYSSDIDHIIDRLIEIRNTKTCTSKIDFKEIQTDPDILEKRVIDALKHHRYSMMFQRIECAEKCTYDSSIKLLDDLGKIIHHKSYMPIISRLRLNREFDFLQLEAIYKLTQQNKEGIFTINISPSSLRQYQFLERVQILFSNSEFEGRLIFVISEKEYYGNIKRYNEILRSYRRIGIKIAIDNLGSNQTSLLYMKDLDIDIILFDNSFSKHINKAGYKEIVEGLCVSAKALELKTWVKMIENEEMYEVAKAMKIDYLQGHYIGKFDTFENIIKEDQ